MTTPAVQARELKQRAVKRSQIGLGDGWLSSEMGHVKSPVQKPKTKLPPETGGDSTKQARCSFAKPDVQIQLIQMFPSPHMVSSQHGCLQAGRKPSRIASALKSLEHSGPWRR